MQIILCDKRMEINSKANTKEEQEGKAREWKRVKWQKDSYKMQVRRRGISEGGRQKGTYQNGEIWGLMKRHEERKTFNTECHGLCQHFLVCYYISCCLHFAGQKTWVFYITVWVNGRKNQGLNSYCLIFLVMCTDSPPPRLILRIVPFQASYGSCPHAAYIPARKADK